MNGNDAGVVELSGDLRLLEKAHEGLDVDLLDLRFVLRIPLAQHDLHRQVATQVLVPDVQDRAHPAASDLALHAIASLLQPFEERPRLPLGGGVRGGSADVALVEGDPGVDILAIAAPQALGDGLVAAPQIGLGLGLVNVGHRGRQDTRTAPLPRAVPGEKRLFPGLVGLVARRRVPVQALDEAVGLRA